MKESKIKQRKEIDKINRQKSIMNINKGITLIALVITIIVLLILAGVSISTLTGDNGILTQAQQASDNSQIAEVEERIYMWRAEITAYEATKIGDNPQTEEEFLEELENEGFIVLDDTDDINKTIIVNETVVSYWYEDVNSPKISDGMIPIKWNGTNWEICSQDDEEWYNYVNQQGTNDGTSMWANVMLSDGTYKDATAVGQTIETTELGSMFVWIPRYSYSITSGYHTSEAGTIEIKFLQGSTNTAINGMDSWDNKSGEGNWNVHPAFTFGENELTGFWVAKFETSQNVEDASQLAIIPNVSSWVEITVGEAFNNSLNMNSDEDNIYGMSTSDSEIDPHLMLNSEWGAVAYLTQSSYGRNKTEIEMNAESYVTGGNAIEGVAGYLTNVGQSTTGNVTGIYDMSGGSWERIAAYIDNESTNLNNGLSLLEKKDTKYVEVYKIGISDSQEENYKMFENTYGDALYETSSSAIESTSWYLDFSITPYEGLPFFRRGGSYANSTDAGLFDFYGYNGCDDTNGSFRPVLAL